MDDTLLDTGAGLVSQVGALLSSLAITTSPCDDLNYPAGAAQTTELFAVLTCKQDKHDSCPAPALGGDWEEKVDIFVLRVAHLANQHDIIPELIQR